MEEFKGNIKKWKGDILDMFVIGEKVTLKYDEEEVAKIVRGKVIHETIDYVQLRINVEPYRKIIYKKNIKGVL